MHAGVLLDGEEEDDDDDDDALWSLLVSSLDLYRTTGGTSS